MFRFSFIVILILFTFSLLFSQKYPIDKKASLVTGSLSFSSSGGELYENSDVDRFDQTEINLSYHYFIIKHFALGIVTRYSKYTQGQLSITNLSIDPNLTIAFGGEKSKGFPFLSGGYSYSKISGAPSDASRSDLSVEVGVINKIKGNLGSLISFSYHMVSHEGRSGNYLLLLVGIVGLIY